MSNPIKHATALKIMSPVLFGLFCFLPVFAVADDDIPTYKTLSCEHDCPSFIPAKLLSTSLPHYPQKYLGDYVEALVDVDYTIATDGSVKSPVVEYLMGPQAFADAALSAVGQRKYQPAIEAGTPVEENHRVRFMFTESGLNKGARADVVAAYARAVRAAKNGKNAEALEELNAMAAKPALNLYERTMIAYAQAAIDMATKDYWSGQSAIRLATINGGHFLDNWVRENALRLRITLEALNGDFADSFAWFEILKEQEMVKKDDDPSSQLIKRLHAAIEGPTTLAMDVRIPASVDPETSTPALWHHTLLRRSFEFSHVEGKLDHFDLLCDRHSIRSPVSEKADWTVPASWSGCNINVHGSAGAKFQFLELPPVTQ